MEYNAPEYKEVIEAEPGHIFKDWMDEGIRCLIMRGPVALCAYLGLPQNHPFCKFSYDEIPLRVHWGLTFGSVGKNNLWPKGYKWYGWDYGHCEDVYIIENQMINNTNGTFWTVEMVEKEVRSAVYDFRKLVLMVEKALLRKEGFLIAESE